MALEAFAGALEAFFKKKPPAFVGACGKIRSHAHAQS
jgi:hypothetical protein